MVDRDSLPSYLLTGQVTGVIKIVWDDGDAGAGVEGAHVPRGEAQTASNALALPRLGLVRPTGTGQAGGACVRGIVSARRARKQCGRGGEVAVGAERWERREERGE